MNALAALKEELSKKRKQASTSSRQSGGKPAKRWRSQADIEAERREAYFAREKEDSEKRKAVRERRLKEQDGYNSQPSQRGQEKGSRLNAQTNVEPSDTNNSAAEVANKPPTYPPLIRQEVIARLRSLKEPATLFGENLWDRFNRMRDRELAREEQTKGQKNVFQEKMRQLEAKDAEDDLHQYTGAKLPQQKTTSTEKGNADDLEEPSCKEDYVHQQLQKYMRLWQSEIDEMSKEERRTTRGRSLIVTYEQTKDWLAPLYKLLRKKKVPSNILNGLRNIFAAAGEREYVQAYSYYLEQLAIGNAPWPMGATMVGIHARAAREKIGEDKIAHVMNDEQTRKYIQGVKRLLTVAQRHFPTTPSKMIL